MLLQHSGAMKWGRKCQWGSKRMRKMGRTKTNTDGADPCSEGG